MNRILIFILILIGSEACNFNSPIKISEIDGNEFISCNIDRIKDVHPLYLSEIAESCEIILLEDDPILNEEDYRLGDVTISKNFIVAMPEQSPALLYSRSGKFIKRLGGDGKQKYLWAIGSQINKREDKVYIQVPGFAKLHVYSLRDNSFCQVDWAIKPTYDFILIDSTTLYGQFFGKEHWGYFQPIAVPVANLIPARYSNMLYPYFKSYQLLYDGDNIVLDSHRDTTYFFNTDKRSFTPFLRCYSEKYKINPYRFIENISLYGSDFEKITEGKPYKYKDLIYASDGIYIFSIYKPEHDKDYFLTINRNECTAFYIDTLINDFWGNSKVEVKEALKPYYRYNNKDGYLTFYYSMSQFKKELNKLDFRALDESIKIKAIQLHEKLKNEEKYYNVLFINKLKN